MMRCNVFYTGYDRTSDITTDFMVSTLRQIGEGVAVNVNGTTPISPQMGIIEPNNAVIPTYVERKRFDIRMDK